MKRLFNRLMIKAYINGWNESLEWCIAKISIAYPIKDINALNGVIEIIRDSKITK